MVSYNSDYRSQGKVHQNRSGKTKVKTKDRFESTKSRKGQDSFYKRTEGEMAARDKTAGIERYSKTAKQKKKRDQETDAKKERNRKRMQAIGTATKSAASAQQGSTDDSGAHAAAVASTTAYASRHGRTTPGRAQQIIRNRRA